MPLRFAKIHRNEHNDGEETTVRLPPQDRLFVEVMAVDNNVDVAAVLEIQFDGESRAEVSVNSGHVTFYT